MPLNNRALFVWLVVPLIYHRNTLEAINNEMFLVNDDVVLWLHGDNRLGNITRFSWGQPLYAAYIDLRAALNPN